MHTSNNFEWDSISAALGVELVEVNPPTVDISASVDEEDLRAELRTYAKAAKIRSPRYVGEIVERKFELRGARHGLRMARATTGCVTWDYVIVAKQAFYTTQVKHTVLKDGSGYGLALRRSGYRMYKPGDFQMLAVLTPAPVPETGDAWYIIPFEEVEGKGSILLPRLPIKTTNHYAQFRERWDLFR